ncbi:MAG: hypothetical protein ACE5IR_04970 [bacterium]
MNKTRLLFLALGLFYGVIGPNANAQIAVIVNKNNSISDIALDNLKNIYLGKVSTFSNRTSVVLSEYAPVKKQFYKTLLNKDVSSVKKYWISYVLSGKSSSPPIEIKNLDEVQLFMSKNPGAICFVKVSELDNRFKALTVDGKKPGSAQYPLKYRSRPK